MASLDHQHNLIHCGTSAHFWNKENRAPYKRLCAKHTSAARQLDPSAPDVYDGCWAFSRFATTALHAEQLTGHILAGLAWIPSTFGGNGRRVNANWQRAELIAVDYDNNVSVADCLAVPFIRQHALLVHPSASSSAACYKTRVIFLLDVPITGDLENYRLAVTALCRLLGLPDDACSYKPSQLYYGSTNRIETPHININARLPGSLIDPLVARLRAEAEKRAHVQAATRAALEYRPVDRNSQRAQSAIDRAVDDAYNKVAFAPSDRTRAAYGQAYRLGRYVPYWSLDERRIETELLKAAGANRSLDKYGDRELLRHIQNGITDGKRDPEPLELPARRPTGEKLRVVRRDQNQATAQDDNEQQTEPKQSLYFHAEGFAVEQWAAVFAAFGSNKSAHKLFFIVYEGARRGLIDPQDVTVDYLLAARNELAMRFPDPSLRATFHQFGELFSVLQIVETTMGKSDNNSSRGPRDRHYTLLPREDMERNLLQWAEKRFEEKRHQKRGTTPPLNMTMAGALTGDARRAALEIMPDLPAASDQARTSAWLARRDFSELARSLNTPHFVEIPADCEDIRAAVLAAENDPDTPLPQAEIERKYGISRPAVLIKRAGLEAVEQTVDCPVTSSATFDREVFEARKAKRGFPVALIEVKPTGEQVQHYYQPGDPEGNREVVAAAHQRGNTINLRLRTANKYQRAVASAQPVVEQAPKPASRRAVGFHEPSEIRPYYGPGYNPTIVRQWLKTHLVRLGWKISERGLWVNPDTGDKFDLSERGFLDFAESLGAEVQALA